MCRNAELINGLRWDFEKQKISLQRDSKIIKLFCVGAPSEGKVSGQILEKNKVWHYEGSLCRA